MLGNLKRHLGPSPVFCDLFSGSAVVAQTAKRMGFQVISNDIQTYSVVLQHALVGISAYPKFERLFDHVPEIPHIKVPSATAVLTFGLGPASRGCYRNGARLLQTLGYLETLPPEEGPFFHAYCDGGEASRTYFSAENGGRCERIRNTIESWHIQGWINEDEYTLLLASLLSSMDQIANTASVYAAYLKRLKPTALKPLRLRFPILSASEFTHRALCGDSNKVIRSLAEEGTYDILYLDPPYNRRQYHSNYHILETLARWDLTEFTPAGKTGLRPAAEQRSPYCLKKHAAPAFQQLIQQANFRHILVSYNNEGLISEEELKDILLEKANSGKVNFHKIPYRRFRADSDSPNRNYKGDCVEEFLFYAQVKSPQGKC